MTRGERTAHTHTTPTTTLPVLLPQPRLSQSLQPHFAESLGPKKSAPKLTSQPFAHSAWVLHAHICVPHTPGPQHAPRSCCQVLTAARCCQQHAFLAVHKQRAAAGPATSAQHSRADAGKDRVSAPSQGETCVTTKGRVGGGKVLAHGSAGGAGAAASDCASCCSCLQTLNHTTTSGFKAHRAQLHTRTALHATNTPQVQQAEQHTPSTTCMHRMSCCCTPVLMVPEVAQHSQLPSLTRHHWV